MSCPVAGFGIDGAEPSDSVTNSVTATGRGGAGGCVPGHQFPRGAKMDILNKKIYFLPLANFKLLGQN